MSRSFNSMRISGIGVPGSLGRAGISGPKGLPSSTYGFDGFEGLSGLPGCQGQISESFSTQNTLYVDGTYGSDITNPNACPDFMRNSLINPYQTISQAITDANSGDKIIVHRGTYLENLSISKNLTIDFRGSTIGSLTQSGTTLVVAGSGIIVWIKGFPTILSNSIGVQISGGAEVYGKFKNIEASSLGVDISSGSADINFRDIDSGNSGNETFKITNGDVVACGRDLNKVNSSGRVLEITGSSNCNLHFRDLVKEVNTNNTQRNNLLISGGTTLINCRDIYVSAYLHFTGSTTLANLNFRDTFDSGTPFLRQSGADVISVFRRKTNSTFGGNAIRLEGGGSMQLNFDEIRVFDLGFFASNQSTNLTIDSRYMRVGNDASINSTTGTHKINIDCTKYFQTPFNGSFHLFDINPGTELVFKVHHLNILNRGFRYFSGTKQQHIKVDRFESNDSSFPMIVLDGGDDTFKVNYQGHKISGPVVINDTTLTTSEDAIINISGTTKAYFNVDKINNTSGAVNGGLALYFQGDDKNTEAHFWNTIFTSNSLAIALEETGTGTASPEDLNMAAKLFLHGSNTIIGGGETGTFETDSTSIVTINPNNGNRAVLINEGRVNAATEFEITPKNTSVKEPIAGPEGAKNISIDYETLY